MAKATSKSSKSTKSSKSSKAAKAAKPAAKAAKPAKKVAKAAAETTRARHDREALMPEIVELRDAGHGWEKIAKDVGVDPGLARLLYMTAKVKPKDRIKGDDETVAAGIVAARQEDHNSWGLIAARTRLPESKVRGIYRETTGLSDKEGYAAVQARVAAKPAAAKTTKSAKAAKVAKTATAKSKKASTNKARKAKTGSANPSKG